MPTTTDTPPELLWFRASPPWNCGDEDNPTAAPSLATAQAITEPIQLIHLLPEAERSQPAHRVYVLPAPDVCGEQMRQLAAWNMLGRIDGTLPVDQGNAAVFIDGMSGYAVRAEQASVAFRSGSRVYR
jgi:hypothetical protein